MQGIERWKLADELNIYQIAPLFVGYDPSELDDFETRWPDEVRRETLPFLSAIKNAARSGKFTFRQVDNYNGNDIDWRESTIDIETFTMWLRGRNFTDGFFIPTVVEEVSSIFNPMGAHYAPKLAAAVRAWTEVTGDPALLSGKSPKKALEIWLRKHANEYGLTGKDGNPNNLGIEEICKVANWKPGGGVSPTPSSGNPPTLLPRMGRQVPTKGSHPNFGRVVAKKPEPIDDDIPF